MTVKDLTEKCSLKVLNMGNEDAEVSMPYCCDLLSVAMGNAPAGSAWCTVMSNRNTLAVATLTDAACIILCCSVNADEELISKAKEEGLNLLTTDKPIFDTALSVYNVLQ